MELNALTCARARARAHVHRDVASRGDGSDDDSGKDGNVQRRWWRRFPRGSLVAAAARAPFAALRWRLGRRLFTSLASVWQLDASAVAQSAARLTG